MQVTDTLSLAIARKSIYATGSLTARSNNGAIVYCLADASLTSVVLSFDIQGAGSYSVTLKAGMHLLGVMSCTVASGQILWIDPK